MQSYLLLKRLVHIATVSLKGLTRSSGKTESPTFLILFNNTVSVVLFNYSKLHTLVSMVTSATVVTVL
jgi:hypothetical protein